MRKAFLTNSLPGGGAFLGVKEQKGPSGATCSIFPNPANSAVTIEFFTPLVEHTILDVFNSTGKVTGRYFFPKGTVKTRIDISDYPSGLYMLNFNGLKSHWIKKLSVVNCP